MDFWQTIIGSLQLLFSGDAELWEIIKVSLQVSVSAILISLPFAIFIAFLLSHFSSVLTKSIVSIVHTLIAVPAVVIGLFVYLLLSHQGYFGNLGWLFSQKAMIIGQILLAFPIVVCGSYSAFKSLDSIVWENAITLGAKHWQALLTLMFECRFAMMSAVIMAFSRIIAEVGSALMVGGNILHYTRNITTAIALETSKGEFLQGIALGVVLVFLALMLNFMILLLNKKKKT